MKLIYTLLLSLTIIVGHGQDNKKLIDSLTCSSWQRIATPKISDDGNYFAYLINFDDPKIADTLKVSATNRIWGRDLTNVRDYFFVRNRLLVLNQRNELYEVELGGSMSKLADNVESIRSVNSDKRSWLITKYRNGKATFIPIFKASDRTFQNVKEIVLSEHLSSAAIISESNQKTMLTVLNLVNGKVSEVGTDNGILSLKFSSDDNMLAWVSEGLKSNKKHITYFNVPNRKSKNIALPDSVQIDGIERFTHNGKNLFITAFVPKTQDKNNLNERVKIWNYQDAKLLPFKEKEGSHGSYLFMVELGTEDLNQVQYKNETYQIYESGKYVHLIKRNATMDEQGWNAQSKPGLYLFDADEKTRKEVDLLPGLYSLSPDENYLTGYDHQFRYFRTLDIRSGIVTSYDFPDSTTSIPNYDQKIMITAGWIGKNTLLYYDQYDLWQVELGKGKAPVCLTNGFGRKNNISFRISHANENYCFTETEIALLTAFDHNTKQNGFFRLAKNDNDPEMLIMSDHYYHYPRSATFTFANQEPVKARNKNRWLVFRESSDVSKNIFVTDDFKTFTKVTSVNPEQRVNWLTSELVDVNSLDGQKIQALIYKPENFDPAKHYPVIMHYYERKSQNKNIFLAPALTGGHINIPWFVSRGYIVCTPDIHFKVGHTGTSIVNAVLGAALTISKLPYVDSTKIGLTGHSLGGYETNYIISQTNFFKAAVSGSGFSDLVQLSGSVARSGLNIGYSLNTSLQLRLGRDLWDMIPAYIENSPVFYTNNVRTPVLLMANDRDGIVNVEQGIEFFVSLRRLGRPSWLLQYKDGDHGLDSQEDCADYTSKIESFFDHYLKGKPMPKWMKNVN